MVEQNGLVVAQRGKTQSARCVFGAARPAPGGMLCGVGRGGESPQRIDKPLNFHAAPSVEGGHSQIVLNASLAAQPLGDLLERLHSSIEIAVGEVGERCRLWPSRCSHIRIRINFLNFPLPSRVANLWVVRTNLRRFNRT
jgi:hypothetical protein